MCKCKEEVRDMTMQLRDGATEMPCGCLLIGGVWNDDNYAVLQAYCDKCLSCGKMHGGIGCPSLSPTCSGGGADD